MSNNLIFFNTDGYPYNFTYDTNTDIYTGKIMFDHNGSDTFKAQNLYIFQDIAPVQFTTTVQLRSLELFDHSGMTITRGNQTPCIITNIDTVNDGPYYSKWIFGPGFESKFPIGSMIKFSGITSSNFIPLHLTSNPYLDFQNKYYTVIDNKPGAIMILTPTVNTSFDSIYVSGSTSTVISENYIIYTDYTGDVTPATFSAFNLYTGQTLSMVDPNDNINNGLYHVQNFGLSNNYYKEYTLNSGLTGQLKIELVLLNERPKLYNGSLIISGLTPLTCDVKFVNGLNSQMISTGEINVGQQMVFEDYNGYALFGNATFTVNSIITQSLVSNSVTNLYKKYNRVLTQYNYFNSGRNTNFPIAFSDENNPPSICPSQYIAYDYFLELSATTSLEINDQIILTGNSGLNIGRQITITDIYQQNPGYSYYKVNTFIPETGITYKISKILTDSEIKDIICTTTLTVPSQTGIGIAYSTSNKLDFTQEIMSNDPYYYLTFQNIQNKFKSTFNGWGVDVYTLINSAQSYIQTNFMADGMYNIDASYQNYINVNVFLITGTSIIQLTANTLPVNLTRYYINTQENFVSSRFIERYNTAVAKEFFTQIDFNLNNDIRNYGFNLRLNGTDFYVSFSADTMTTLNAFVYDNAVQDPEADAFTYQDIFYLKGFNLYSSGNSLYIQGLYPNIEVNEFKITVNDYSTYNISTYQDAQGDCVIGSDLILSSASTETFYDYGLATGMIISISGSNVFNSKEYNIIGLTEKILTLSYQGHFEPVNLYSFNASFSNAFNIAKELSPLTITSREFLRRPRLSYTKDYYYRFSWVSTYDNSIFYYDFSGQQPTLTQGPLDTNGNRISSLIYKGITPLWDPNNPQNLYFKNSPNLDTLLVSDPSVQQTVFTQIEFKLDQLDSQNVEFVPVPLQIFLAYQSDTEGVNNNQMLMELVEYLTLEGVTNSIDNPNGVYWTITSGGTLTYNAPTGNTNLNLYNYGFETGQIISIQFIDNDNKQIFENYENYLIDYVSSNVIQLNTGVTSNPIVPFITSGSTKGFNYKIEVMPKPVMTCSVWGETEIEDERFYANLKSVGVTLNEDVEQIFPESDIEDQGIDYVLLNRKRKEMLSSYPDIFNYVGSYKALINAINFFGYNDLQVYEYYRVIDINSPLFNKLVKMIIPDIFDNSVPGWNEQVFIKDLDRNKYHKTNLFNLTYQITDEDGNYIQTYSLDEVTTKLMGLKKWLKSNILPLSTNILDITGVADSSQVNSTRLESYNITKYETNRYSTAINFFFKETQNFDNQFFLTIEFYTINPDFDPAQGWTCKIKTFSKDSFNQLQNQQYFSFYKTDLDPITISINKDVDPYLWVEATIYNEDGQGSSVKILRNMQIARNYYLINHNLHTYLNGLDYLYVGTHPTGLYYFFNDEGYMFVSEPWFDQNYTAISATTEVTQYPPVINVNAGTYMAVRFTPIISDDTVTFYLNGTGTVNIDWGIGISTYTLTGSIQMIAKTYPLSSFNKTYNIIIYV